MYQNYMQQNPMISPTGQFNSPYARKEIVKVRGENGALMYAQRMPPNSTDLVIDELNQSIAWYVQTDGAGYPTVTAYDLTLHIPQEQVTNNQLEERIKRLEDIVNGLSDEPANAAAKKSKSSAGQRSVE